jgi:hypothetical protein
VRERGGEVFREVDGVSQWSVEVFDLISNELLVCLLSESMTVVPA